MFFLSDFAEFNRQINVKRHTRVINGRVVPVRGARRMVLRLKDALEDLRLSTGEKYGKEFGYNMNPRTGIVGQRITGGRSSINMGELYDSKHNRHKIASRDILHSHPSESSLSTGDFFNLGYGKNNRIFAITPRGSVYRGYRKVGSEFLDRNKIDEHVYKINDYFYNEMSNFFNNHSEKELKNIMGDLHNKVSIRKESLKLAVHARNTFLKEIDAIHYRHNLSDYDKKLIEIFKPQFDAVVNNQVKSAKFRIPKDYKNYLNATGKTDILTKYKIKT